MRFPSDTQRHVIVGRTGTGKTQAGIYALSVRSIQTIPWIVYDFKADELINEIPFAKHIELSDMPEKPGVYIVHPHPDQVSEIEAQMWKIWERENMGVFVDEGYMVCNPLQPNRAFRSILTQGRSKHVPVIILSQRPVWLDRFVFSEADFFQVFPLNDKRDRATIASYMPVNLDERLPDYHSYYYDVARDSVAIMKPVPVKVKILNSFRARLAPPVPPGPGLKGRKVPDVVFI